MRMVARVYRVGKVEGLGVASLTPLGCSLCHLVVRLCTKHIIFLYDYVGFAIFFNLFVCVFVCVCVWEGGS